jgi:hypothetical protein
MVESLVDAAERLSASVQGEPERERMQ